jgi:pentatricopeptide repeat protein
VEEAFEQMQQASVPPTGTTYMALIRAACVSRDLPRAMHWLRQMRSRRLAAPVRVFNWLIYACLNAGDTATLVEVLRGMERDQVEPNRVTLRAKDHIIRLLATRMKLVSSSMLSRLSQAIDKAQQA